MIFSLLILPRPFSLSRTQTSISMDAPNDLPYESSSCARSSLHSLGDSHGSSSFIEMDRNRILEICESALRLNLPLQQSLVPDHKDDIFLGLPLGATNCPPRTLLSHHKKKHQPDRPSSSMNSVTMWRCSQLDKKQKADGVSKSSSMGQFYGYLKKVIWRYWSLLMKLCKKLKRIRSRKSTKSCENSGGRMNNISSCSGIELCRSNADILINDAVLYCKRSNVRF